MNALDIRARAAHLDEARKRYAAWMAQGAPGRLRLPEHEGGNVCEAVYGTGAQACLARLRTLCAVLAALISVNGWKLFWYKLAGARIGRNVYISHGAKLDVLAPWLITLEDGCTLGVDAVVAVHLYHRSQLVLRKIRVGKRAVVGIRAIAFASLDDDAVLGPNSVLLSNAPAGAPLLGVPAHVV